MEIHNFSASIMKHVLFLLLLQNREPVPLCGGDGVGHVTHPMTAGGGTSVAVAEGDHQCVSMADLEIQHAQKVAVACHEIQHDAMKRTIFVVIIDDPKQNL